MISLLPNVSLEIKIWFQGYCEDSVPRKAVGCKVGFRSTVVRENDSAVFGPLVAVQELKSARVSGRW